MHIRSIYLHNFRNYTEKFFEFSSSFNEIYGANAQGKTSLLEAIYFLIAGRSFRTNHPQEMIRQQNPFFYIEASFVRHEIEQKLKISFNGREKKIFYNQTQISHLSGTLGLLLGVAITPDDVNLIKGSPQNRRHFLDLQIAQINPLYVHHLSRYNRAMRQRNALLRGKNLLTIESWEHEMAASAAYITQQRAETLKTLHEEAKTMHSILSGEKESLSFEYKSAIALNDLESIRLAYLHLFHKSRPKETLWGYTINGPQKDDFLVMLGNKEVRYFASDGQQRSCVTAMQFAVWKCLKLYGNQSPLMLIDDIGVGLDEKRRQKLLEELSKLKQVFLTSTDSINWPFSEKEKKSFIIQNLE